VIDVGGVGYGVLVALDLRGAPRAGAAGRLVIHTHVREDQLQLYGFATPDERLLSSA
jgi:Holliday junction DNA helicase RuvA